MKKFDVEITETLQRKVSVEAASQEDAERMVTQAWNNQDYVLDSGDFTGVDFKTVGEHELAETRTMDLATIGSSMKPIGIRWPCAAQQKRRLMPIRKRTVLTKSSRASAS